MAEFQTVVLMLRLTSQVNIPITRVAEWYCLRINIIYQSVFLTQTQVQPTGHAATAKDIIEQVHGQLLGVADRVGMRAKHDMGLVGVAAKYACGSSSGTRNTR